MVPMPDYSTLSPAALRAERFTSSPTHIPQERIREIASAKVPGYPFLLARMSSPSEPVSRSWHVLATDLPTASSIATSGQRCSSAKAITDASPGSRTFRSQGGMDSSLVQTRIHFGGGVFTPGLSGVPRRTSSRTIGVIIMGCARIFNTSHEPVAAATDIKTPVSIGRGWSDTGVLRYLVGIGHGGRQPERARFQNEIASGKARHLRRLSGSDFPLLEKTGDEKQAGLLFKFRSRHSQHARQRVRIRDCKCVWHICPF